MENNEAKDTKVEVKEDKHKKKKDKKNEELELLQNQNAILNEKLLRITADYQNMKRRSEEELQKAYKYDGEDVIKELLQIVDNFERAIKLDDDNLTDELSKFLEGFKMIYTNLINILNDKNVHEIGMEPGKVVEVLQKGYIYNDKVIRPAMVKVSE